MSEGIEQTGLVKYDAMQRAILVASKVDEVKDIRDKAMALEKYAQQARNFDAEKRAATIRIHAEMQGALLWRQQEKAKGAAEPGGKKNGKHGKITRSPDETTCPTLEDLGVSKTQMHRWQHLADDPQAVRDYLRECEDVPTTAGAINAVQESRGKPEPVPPPLPFTDEALWLSGRLRDLAQCGLDPPTIFKGADEPMRNDIRRNLMPVLALLNALQELLT